MRSSLPSHAALALWLAVLALACGDRATGPQSAAIARITLEPVATELEVGGARTLQATAYDASGAVVPGVTFFWASGDNAVAEVSATGLVRARAAGTAQIAASAQGRHALATVSVRDIAVAFVEVTPTSAQLVVGGTVPLQATARSAAGAALAGRSLTWSSSDPAVAQVDQQGRVSGVAAGSAVITATSEGRSGTAAVTVTPVPVAGVQIAPGTAELTVGQTTQLAATARDANGGVLSGRTVQWSSGAPAVATVSSTGTVTALAPGTAIVTAAIEGRSATATITVRPVPAAAVVVSPANVGLVVGASADLSAQVTDASGNVLASRPVSWATDNAAVATVTAGGRVTAVAPGTVTVTASSSGIRGSATVVVSPVPVAAVEVTPSTASLVVGAERQLTPVVRDAAGNVLAGRNVTWRSGAPEVATVSATGRVQAVAPGSAVITATSEGRSGTATVTVTPVPVASVTVSPASARLAAGAQRQLAATVRDAAGNALTGRVVTWSSTDAGVAVVSSDGLVLAVGAGTATIRATSEGVVGSASVTVDAAPPPPPPPPAPVASVEVSPGSATLEPGQQTTLTATPRDAAGNALTGRAVSWASSNDAVATVSGSGVVTAVAPGSATITATSEGKTGSAAVQVNAPPPPPPPPPSRVARLEVSPPALTVRVGNDRKLNAHAYDSAGRELDDVTFTWQVADPAVLQLKSEDSRSRQVEVKGMKVGATTVTVSAEGKSATAPVTVIP